MEGWCYDNDAYFGAEEKRLGGSNNNPTYNPGHQHSVLDLHEGRMGSSNPQTTGWLVPKDMMEMVEKGQIKNPH